MRFSWSHQSSALGVIERNSKAVQYIASASDTQLHSGKYSIYLAALRAEDALMFHVWTVAFQNVTWLLG
jgi:hypothetical protein